jgi:transposase|tara:strand:+ start:116 stop:613 length:498 start_codon:yes stop_codon:yes gene_type:complete
MFGIPFLGILSAITQGVGTMMSIQAQKQTLAYQEMQYRMQERQFRQEAEARELEARQAEIDRKARYERELAENRALMAASGIALDSASYRAFLQSNRDVYKQDRQAIRSMGLERRLNALYSAQQANISVDAARASYKTGVMETVRGAVDNLTLLKREFTTTKSEG